MADNKRTIGSQYGRLEVELWRSSQGAPHIKYEAVAQFGEFAPFVVNGIAYAGTIRAQYQTYWDNEANENNAPSWRWFCNGLYAHRAGTPVYASTMTDNARSKVYDCVGAALDALTKVEPGLFGEADRAADENSLASLQRERQYLTEKLDALNAQISTLTERLAALPEVN